MALNRPVTLAFGGAALAAGAMPLLLLWPSTPAPVSGGKAEVRPVMAPPVPPLVAVYERPLLAPAEGVIGDPVDAPALIGIAGRLNQDAVALVRQADGGSRSLSVGDSVDGWRLESLAIDAAFFTRGRERVRVALRGDEPPAGQD